MWCIQVILWIARCSLVILLFLATVAFFWIVLWKLLLHRIDFFREVLGIRNTQNTVITQPITQIGAARHYNSNLTSSMRLKNPYFGHADKLAPQGSGFII